MKNKNLYLFRRGVMRLHFSLISQSSFPKCEFTRRYLRSVVQSGNSELTLITDQYTFRGRLGVNSALYVYSKTLRIYDERLSSERFFVIQTFTGFYLNRSVKKLIYRELGSHLFEYLRVKIRLKDNLLCLIYCNQPMIEYLI